MKQFMKRNKITLGILLILILCTILLLIQYKVEYNQSLKDYYEMMEYLEDHPSPITPKKPIMYDTYTLFSYIVVDSPMGIIMYVMPLIVMLCGINDFYLKMKSGFFKDECMRRKYGKNMVINVLSSWKHAVLIPIYVILVLIGCYFTTKSFDIHRTVEFYEYSLINRRYLDIMPTYFIVYIINLILLGLFYINIALIVAKKNSNLFVTLVQSYLIFIVVGIFTEVVCGKGLERLFPILKSYYLCNSLAIFNFWVYENVMSLPFMFLFAFMLFLLSTIVLFFQYKDKESVNLEIDQ